MKELVELITKAIVDEPDKVDVREVEDAEGVMVELRVAQNDVGQVIGRQGRTIKALRTLVHAAAIKSQKNYGLEVIEDQA